MSPFQSTLTCPHSGHQTIETMPEDAGVYFHECAEVLKPEPGDCCVFCSCGNNPCRSVQRWGRTCFG